MHGVEFLHDLAVVMIVAGVVTVLFRKLHQPVVLGYILAGLIIGPHLLPKPLITSEESIHTLAELGVVFLLFALGLEFNFRKIRKIGITAFIVAPLETALMFLLGYQIGQWFGWTTMDCVYLGGIMMISSTTIISKTLAEMKKSNEEFAGVIFGILIAEDIIAILLIASLSGVGIGDGFQWSGIMEIILRLSVFLVMAVVVGLLVVPRLLRMISRFRNDETLLIAALGLLFGMAMLAVELKFSVALGAFIIGAVIAESDEIHKIDRLTVPLRDMFSAVFFVAIGLLIEPKLLVEFAVPILVITAAVVFGKITACSFGCFVAGYDRRVAIQSGLGLSQIGEFSFIIAALGVSLNVTSHFLYPIAVAVSALTSMMTPYLIRHSGPVIQLYHRLAPQLLMNYQDDYTAWIAQLRATRRRSVPSRLIRTMILQMTINITLVAGIFLLAIFFSGREVDWLLELPAWSGGKNAVLWVAAMLLSLPILIATLRKLQAMSMMISELTVRFQAERQRVAMRAMVSNTILFTGIIVIGLFILLFSSALLPPTKLLFVLGLLALVVAVLLKTFFIRIYSRAQVAIRETLAREAPHPQHEHLRALPGLPDDVELMSVHLNGQAVGLGKTILQTELRARTGASIVALKREGKSLVNPPPATTLLEGDELLVLGGPAQLEGARKLLE
ncbi:MAG TPA: cation/H(+) antiporter [Verrucomicrobiales bacterium]|nr:cation/H(+) antiporter [Verrucomicrobiales bacterium]